MKKFIASAMVCGSLLYAESFNEGMAMLDKGEDKKAYESFFLAAKSGDIDSQTILGEMYLDGIGIKADTKKAFFWLSKAAREGDIEAQYLLGFMYENGINVQTDIKRATKWYTKAALKGDVLSQYNLAIIYKEGKGEVTKDMQKAFKWLSLVEKKKIDVVEHIASK